ncbi:hypothetical protein JCM18899A_49630 [Nocardioides sp. AN3]
MYGDTVATVSDANPGSVNVSAAAGDASSTVAPTDTTRPTATMAKAINPLHTRRLRTCIAARLDLSAVRPLPAAMTGTLRTATSGWHHQNKGNSRSHLHDGQPEG